MVSNQSAIWKLPTNSNRDSRNNNVLPKNDLGKNVDSSTTTPT